MPRRSRPPGMVQGPVAAPSEARSCVGHDDCFPRYALRKFISFAEMKNASRHEWTMGQWSSSPFQLRIRNRRRQTASSGSEASGLVNGVPATPAFCFSFLFSSEKNRANGPTPRNLNIHFGEQGDLTRTCALKKKISWRSQRTNYQARTLPHGPFRLGDCLSRLARADCSGSLGRRKHTRKLY